MKIVKSNKLPHAFPFTLCLAIAISISSAKTGFCNPAITWTKEYMDIVDEKELTAYRGDQFRLILKNHLGKVVIMRIYEENDKSIIIVYRYDLSNRRVDLKGNIQIQEIDYKFIRSAFSEFERGTPFDFLSKDQAHAMNLLDGTAVHLSWKTQTGKGSFELNDPHHFEAIPPERFRSVYGFEKPDLGLTVELVNYLFSAAGLQMGS